MAQKKATIELTIVEVQHLLAAVSTAQDEHERTLGRKNPALTRVQVKVAQAQVDIETPEKDKDEDESTG